MRTIAIALMAALALAGCKQQVKIISPELKPYLDVKDPEPLDLKEVKWIVLTESNAASTFARLRAEGVKPYVFALTEGSYQELRLNDARIMKYIKQQKQVIVAYRNYYSRSEAEAKRKKKK